VLGELIAQLDRPEIAASVFAALDPDVMMNVEGRAAALSMTATEFAAGAVREFMDYADDDLWFQLLTVVRKSDDPGSTAVKTILKWVVSPV
jgi:hypothetical protein